MKKHAIIPIFIPHEGCQHDCVFCNQKIITAKTSSVTKEDIQKTIENYLSTLKDSTVETIEVAFFGGSFTGIPIKKQKEYLQIAYDYKINGIIDKIHMSTRPDYINREILDNLIDYKVDTIELGVQSFDKSVLDASKRGHSEEQVYIACDLIKEYGFELGIQLMIGLPKDTKEKAILSAKKAAAIKPSLCRLYPTVILNDTELLNMTNSKEYTPLALDEAVEITKEMYKILDDANINIMRVGLKSTDLITPENDYGNSYHPAFRQLVEGEIALEKIDSMLMNALHSNKIMNRVKVDIFSNSHDFSNMIGHKSKNKNYLIKKYPSFNIRFKINDELNKNKYLLNVK